MKKIHMLTYSQMKFTLPILGELSVNIDIIENPYQLPFGELFTMAARINKKRAFLFVSKVLGKHIPINPQKGLLAGALLANRYMEAVKGQNTGKREEMLLDFFNPTDLTTIQPFISKKENPVIIGFAETATALGHAFFHCFQKADFFHTTREQVLNLEPAITFEEEHSHATSHRCYIDESLLLNEREIILVDDEMTTGKTNINIIRQIQKKFPRKTYTVVSILDWRSEENRQLFADLEKELNIVIHSVSLLKGTIQLAGTLDIEETQAPSIVENTLISPSITTVSIEKLFPGKLKLLPYESQTLAGKINKQAFIKQTGRFGLHAQANLQLSETLEEIGTQLANMRNGKRTLCLGTGEFMYIPMKVASYMGSGVSYHSTTRSPIYVVKRESYGAQAGLSFPNPEDNEIAHFVYNIKPFEYDEVFLFFERAVPLEKLQPFIDELKKTMIIDVKVIFFNGG